MPVYQAPLSMTKENGRTSQRPAMSGDELEVKSMCPRAIVKFALCGALALIGIASADLAFGSNPAYAQAAAVGPSGLPLPRFVSLKSGRVNLRIGPGLNYPVE